jgi:hypothetical protein
MRPTAFEAVTFTKPPPLAGVSDSEFSSVGIEKDGMPIASVFNGYDFPCVDEKDFERLNAQALADARLIAAAPDLLAALEGILAEPFGCSLCDSGVPRNEAKGHQPSCPFDHGRAAIAKAKGELS